MLRKSDASTGEVFDFSISDKVSSCSSIHHTNVLFCDFNVNLVTSFSTLLTRCFRLAAAGA